MTRAVRWRLFGCCLLLGLAGCARTWFEEREPWRHEAEISCLKSGAVKEGPSIAITKAIEGPGACGVDYPLRVASLGESALMGFAEESRTPRPVAVAPAAAQLAPRHILSDIGNHLRLRRARGETAEPPAPPEASEDNTAPEAPGAAAAPEAAISQRFPEFRPAARRVTATLDRAAASHR